jgi:3-deoxy-7-phosphoheptulonate synthase
MKKSHLPFGLSLESTHEDVTECIGGAHPFEEHHIDEARYKSKCDPRLNPTQIELLIKSMRFN